MKLKQLTVITIFFCTFNFSGIALASSETAPNCESAFDRQIQNLGKPLRDFTELDSLLAHPEVSVDQRHEILLIFKEGYENLATKIQLLQDDIRPMELRMNADKVYAELKSDIDQLIKVSNLSKLGVELIMKRTEQYQSDELSIKTSLNEDIAASRTQLKDLLGTETPEEDDAALTKSISEHEKSLEVLTLAGSFNSFDNDKAGREAESKRLESELTDLRIRKQKLNDTIASIGEKKFSSIIKRILQNEVTLQWLAQKGRQASELLILTNRLKTSDDSYAETCIYLLAPRLLLHSSYRMMYSKYKHISHKDDYDYTLFFKETQEGVVETTRGNHLRLVHGNLDIAAGAHQSSRYDFKVRISAP